MESNKKQLLTQELDNLQEFIDIFDAAQKYNLVFNESAYERYSNAIKRQREVIDIIQRITNPPCEIFTTAQFKRKENELQVDECKIEKVIELTHEQFDIFKENMLDDYDFITENSDLMWVDNCGIVHCMLVIGNDFDDGILVNSEGCSYARYSALLPNARLLIAHHTASLEQEDSISLKQLITCKLSDIHLMDATEEHNLTTISELDKTMLTEEGMREWNDVLSAKVVRIYEGVFGTHVEVIGCDPQRVGEFSFALAGQCAAEDYEKWINKNDIDQASDPVISM